MTYVGIMRRIKEGFATSGLPPSQRIEILNLLLELGQWLKVNPFPVHFESRQDLYRHLNNEIAANGPIDYLEFGVYQGDAINFWTDLNRHPDSRFFGFDTFEGLPEDWRFFTSVVPRGTWGMGGKPPEIRDPRVNFIKGIFQESLPIALRCSNQSLPPQQWRNPTRQIEPFVVLAIGWNPKSFAPLGPTPSQAGMKAKAGLILKNNGFIVFKVKQFFLTPGENGGHPWHEPEDKHNQLFSDCNPDNATSTEPVALSTLSRTLSSGELRVLVHPSQLWRDRTPEEVSPDFALAVSLRTATIESAVLAWFVALKTRYLFDSLHESSLPGSCDLDQTKRLSIPDAGPPKPATRLQFSSQSMPPGLALPGLIAFLALFQVALYSRLS
jgi:hypothetical protein